MSGTYKFGDKSEGIRILQQALTDNGFNPGPVDSVYGPATLNAINDARAAYKLDGINRVDEALLRCLGILPKPKASNPLSDFATGLALKAILNHLKGNPMLASLFAGQKTIITGAIMVLAGALSLLAPIIGLGEVPGFNVLTPGEAWTSLTTGFGLIFLRQGINKVGQ